jgi:hypothetical protein
MCDGVNDHLDLCKTLEAFGDYEEKHRVLFKLVANATSHTQVCDLLKFFHTIKVPDEVLRTITQQDFDRWVGEMTPLLPRFQRCVDKHMFMEVIQVLALLFFVQLKRLDQYQIEQKWASIGWFDNLNNCLARCETRGDIGDEDYKMYEAAIPAMAEEFVREGRCSYAFMRSIGLPCPGLDPDGKSDKSQQCIILTSEGQKTRVLARLQLVQQQNKERDELKERKAARLEQKAAAGSKRKTMSTGVRKQLRAESAAGAE